MKAPWFLLFVLFLFSSPCLAVDGMHAIAMHGEPKYKEGFTHFDYTNLDAPQGGTLRLGVTGSFDSLNPFIVRGQPPMGVNTGQLSLVYESLMARSWDEPFTLYGLVAARVDVADDRSSIVFHLRPEAHWNDGVPLTAEDVLFSYATLRAHGRPNHRTYYKKVSVAEACGEGCVRFVFNRNADGAVDREMPLIMGLMPLLPKHVWEGKTFNETTLATPVASGPYKVSSVDVGRSIIYKRDPAYWGKDLAVQKGMYNFDTIQVDYYRDDAMALQSFKAGQYDVRRELNFSKWSTDYDFPAVEDGRVILERLPHQRAETVNAFALNTRRALFRDDALREAVAYAFDSGWMAKHLFYNLCKRTQSFFPNSELASSDLPQGLEKQILEKYKAQLPDDIFTESVAPPMTDGNEASLRRNLLKAKAILKKAGYIVKDELLYAPSGKQISFEIMLNDPVQEKVALQWVGQLRRLGIVAHPRTVDSAQYQERLAGFDFDVSLVKWNNSLSPGNEQAFFWGSAAAQQSGSRNYPGIHDPVVDALVSAISAAQTRAELVATVHALDRVLLRGHYAVPFFYSETDQIAFWGKVHHPLTTPLYGAVFETWWSK